MGMRRKDLTPSVSVERDRRGIVNGLQNDAATDLNTMSTVLKIVIRIRNMVIFTDGKRLVKLLK